MKIKLFGHPPPLTALVGLFIIEFFALVAVIGPFIAPYEASDIIGKSYEPASKLAWLGTDQLGRDILSRLMHGAHITIGIALATTMVSATIGITFGFTAAVMGGWVDTVISRFVDVMLSIPLLIFALIILGVFGSSFPVLIIAIGALDSLRVFRLARSLGLNLTVLEYVEAARLRGEGNLWIMFKEILPNTYAPLVSEFGLRFCFNFLFIAALSFLGIGIQPPTPDWGGMVKEMGDGITYEIVAPFYPAAAITLMTVGVNLVVDWLLSISAQPSGAPPEL
jgi:peptide/nickel transport system permease protein